MDPTDWGALDPISDCDSRNLADLARGITILAPTWGSERQIRNIQLILLKTRGDKTADRRSFGGKNFKPLP